MKNAFLDLEDAPRVVDFLVENATFADDDERENAEALARSYQDGEDISIEKLAEAARRLAKATWPARRALGRFLVNDGAEDEWAAVTGAVRPSTAHLMKRFRNAADLKTLDQVLAHDEVGTALHEEEMLEIAHVRANVREAIWKAKKGALSSAVEEYQNVLKQYEKRLAALRRLATSLSGSLQDEAFSKIAHYEDRIFFELEEIPLEILDKETAYYKEQAEISPLE